MNLDWLREALEGRLELQDSEFDEVFPELYRRVSARYWTSIEVARHVADLLSTRGVRRVLDVGSGVGKFCLVGAASTVGIEFVGVEQRAHLVQAACAARAALGLERAEFLHGRFSEVELQGFDAFYIYNPFAENLEDSSTQIDQSVLLSPERRAEDVSICRALLEAVPVGTTVVTYCGYGGPMPADYELTQTTDWGCAELDVWVKQALASSRSDPAELHLSRASNTGTGRLDS